MFMLFGKKGCMFCSQALQFLRNHNLPGQVFEGFPENPVIDLGIREFCKLSPDPKVNDGQSHYPLLLVRFMTKNGPREEVIVGFKQDEYERVKKEFIEATNGPDPFTS